MMATPLAPLQSGVVALEFKRSFDFSAGSALWKAIAAAFMYEVEEDSEILLAVMGVDKAGKREELGVARCSLEAILKAGKDLSAAKLEVADSSGAKVGALTCSVTTLRPSWTASF